MLILVDNTDFEFRCFMCLLVLRVVALIYEFNCLAIVYLVFVGWGFVMVLSVLFGFVFIVYFTRLIVVVSLLLLFCIHLLLELGLV